MLQPGGLYFGLWFIPVVWIGTIRVEEVPVVPEERMTVWSPAGGRVHNGGGGTTAKTAKV